MRVYDQHLSVSYSTISTSGPVSYHVLRAFFPVPVVVSHVHQFVLQPLDGPHLGPLTFPPHLDSRLTHCCSTLHKKADLHTKSQSLKLKTIKVKPRNSCDRGLGGGSDLAIGTEVGSWNLKSDLIVCQFVHLLRQKVGLSHQGVGFHDLLPEPRKTLTKELIPIKEHIHSYNLFPRSDVLLTLHVKNQLIFL